MFTALDFITLIEVLGTFAFAISGIKMASRQRIDWFGAYVIGLVTAIGGGTVRDLLLGITPFWMIDPSYLITTGVALISTLLFGRILFRLGKTLFIFDTIGLGLFTIVGLEKSVEAGLPIWVCIIMGTITGSVGGVIRDTLINQVPLLFRKDIYALACVAGGLVYFGCNFIPVSSTFSELIAIGAVILIRLISVKYHLHLPLLQPLDRD